MTRASIAVLSLLVGAGIAAAQQPPTRPPRPLHKVGDHWTPYSPPSEFPADADVYTIKPGDTLWDLARHFLGDPYLWPQIWEKNQYIRDAHWIYPGDPLVVGVKAEKAEAVPPPAPPVATPAPQQPATEEAPAGPGGEGAIPGNLVAVGTEADIYCFAYLNPTSEPLPLTVASSSEIGIKENLVDGDIVYLSGGSQDGVMAGQEYFVVLPAHEIRHPATGARLGMVMRYIGHLRVLCAQDHNATAEILSACDGIPVGAQLKPFEPIPVPMTLVTPPATLCEPGSGKLSGYIVYSRDDIQAFGEGSTVMIDLGEADQVGPGSTFTIFRDNAVQGMPRLVLGELSVLTAGDHWATAKVTVSSRPMAVGDRIELK